MKTPESNEKKLFSLFMGECDMDRLLFHWRWELEQYGVDLNHLFQEVPIYLEEDLSDRHEPVLSWWPKNNANQMVKGLDKIGEIGIWGSELIHPNGLSEGEKRTAEYLWAAKDDETKLAAVLLTASLRKWLHISGKQNWPHPIILEELYNQLIDMWFDGKGSPWHSSSKGVLPYFRSDFYTGLNHPIALMKFLACDHAKLFANHTPVRLVFKKVGTPVWDAYKGEPERV